MTSGKKRKVSTTRADTVLETMQGEVQANRIAEMKQYVWDAMATSQVVSDRCYCVAVDHAKKMASAHHLHRNNDTVGQVPCYHKEQAMTLCKCLRDKTMAILIQYEAGPAALSLADRLFEFNPAWHCLIASQ